MTQVPELATSSNEEIYESLISLIENNQEQLTLIVVACDDLRLRQRTINRYELEAKQSQIQSHRMVLGMEPSLRAGLAKLALPPGEQVVVTVTGAEWLLRVKTRSIDEQSDLDKFFGYLQWTREGLREFRYPIVLWVTYPILQEMSCRAPDFWSWRKAVLRFNAEEEVAESIELMDRDYAPLPLIDRHSDDFLPPPAEIILEIQKLAAREPESANLPVLYQKLAEIYAKRIDKGEATNLEQEQQQAIEAFETAIDQYRKLNDQSALASTLNNFGIFLSRRSHYEDALNFYQQSLAIWHKLGDLNGRASSLANLGNSYELIGQYQLAINFYQQSLAIWHELGDLSGRASSLADLGNICQLLGQYQEAINFFQRSLEINRIIGDPNGEALSLNGLGIAYKGIGEYQRAIDFFQQSLTIWCKLDNLNGKASSLANLGNICQLLGQYQEAINFFQRSLEINRIIGDPNGEALSLNGLGRAYGSIEQNQRSIDFFQQSLEINHEIGNRRGEAVLLFNQALVYTKDKAGGLAALDKFQQARAIFLELNLDESVKRCDEEIDKFNAMIASE